MQNRKNFKSGDHFNSQLLQNHHSTGKIPPYCDYYNRRVFTQMNQDDDQFQMQKTTKKLLVNFNNNTKGKQLNKMNVKKVQKKMMSDIKQKNQYPLPIKISKTNFMISTNNIHQNINIFTEEESKKKEHRSKILLTEGSGKSHQKQIFIRSKERPVKKDSKKLLEKVNFKKEKKSGIKEIQIKHNKSKDFKQKNTTQSIFKNLYIKTQANEDTETKSPEIQIIQKIGQGTFGEVYKARLGGNKIVAIKKVFQDKKYKNRQLQILKLLSNDFVLKVLFTFYTRQKAKSINEQDKQYLNVVMQFYQNNLYQINTESKKLLSQIEIKIYMYQLFRGLNYIHSLDICHRDIKPANILVNKKNFKLVICDFGSAKKLIKSQPNISYICSRCYRAPQLIFGNVNYTTMIDIWSAGCVLLELLTGEPFFIGDSNVDQLVQIIKVMGTPSKTQVINMNPQYDLDDYKFPKIRLKEWHTMFPKADEKLISFIKQIMIYSPKERLNASQALAHQFFDQLRQQTRYKQLITKKNIPALFDFNREQLKGKEHLLPKLIPFWYKPKKDK